ncbi:MAG: hypothetical protein LBS46_01335 [Dysgonamonadaceae bacterium]|jgi:hypothetical protein|nr:hypothetical protein [Dysgonamonadaceae bacterium]
MNKSLLLPILFLLTSVFYACNDGFEDYSTHPDDLLAFSTDTVAFDTILSTINTPYQLFKVYNPHAKALLIASVSLENGANSPFKINVDGRAGADFQNIEIRGNDSIYVLVDVKPVENNSDEPEYLTDYVVFVTHGISQKVLVEASSQDAVLWKGGTVIRSDTVLRNQKPFVVYDSLIIDEGVTLEIQEGTRLYMHGNAEMIVKGSLKIRGTPENPVTIRGDRFDYFVNIPYDRVPGQWGGIRFESNSYNNELQYVYIRNGKYGMDFKRSDPSLSKMKMNNVVMTNFKGVLLNAVNCRIEAENCEFSNAKDAILNLTGGVYSFTHCTIANYYMSSPESGWGNSDNATVRLLGSYWNEATETTEYYPIEHIGFYNSIIWGKGQNSSDIVLDADEKAVVVPFFQNCLIPNKDATNDDPADPRAQIVHCLINKDPKFKLTDSEDLIYNFRLDSLSPARNVADIPIATKLPKDIDGADRFADEGPDMGGYEFVPAKEL